MKICVRSVVKVVSAIALFALPAFAEVSLCQKDPGHHPAYPFWKDFYQTYPTPTCPAGQHVDTTRLAACKSEYIGLISQMDLNIRQCICSCHASFPPSTNPNSPINLCLAECENPTEINQLWEFIKNVYEICLQTVCVAD